MTRPPRGALVRLALVASVSLAGVVASAGPASAHGVGGAQPTNFETIVRGVVPDVHGLTAGVTSDQRIELRNETGHAAVVLGYEGEPYLRVESDGVWQNRRSPAVFLNRTRTPTTEAPRRYDASAPPVWERISEGNVARWHDQRTHWMADALPPEVRSDRDRAHTIIEDWRIPVRWNGRDLDIAGDARWVPGPSAWPWLASATLLAGAVIVGSRTRAWSTIAAAALAVLVVTESLHVLGTWVGSDATIGNRLGENAYSVTAVLLAVAALIWVRRSDAWVAAPAVLIAGLFMAIAGGVSDLAVLSRSQLPTTLAPGLARLTVTAALGLGTGLAVGAALRLRSAPPDNEAPVDPTPTTVGTPARAPKI